VNESLPKGVAQDAPACTEAYAGGLTDRPAGTLESFLTQFTTSPFFMRRG
jgi:hypothetical protein